MLILSRSLGEVLVIGDDIRITVLGITGNQVRLGISAPQHIGVHREEVYLRIKHDEAMRDEEANAPKARRKLSFRNR